MAFESCDFNLAPYRSSLLMVQRLALVCAACSFTSGCFDLNASNQSNFAVYPLSSCQIEGAQSTTLDGWTTRPGRVVVTGWAIDSIASDVPTTLRIQLTAATGEIVHLSQVALRKPRPDVAAHFKDTRFTSSGFESVVDASRLPVGSYKLSVAQYTRQAATICPSERILQIR
jgi:hypothetical protein